MTDPAPVPHTPEAEKKESGAVRLLGRLIPKLVEAFTKASIGTGGERVLWEAFPIAAPNPMQPGNLSTGLALFMSIPSSVVGENLAMTPIIDPGFVEMDQEAVDGFIRDRLSDLLAARQQQLARQNGAGHTQAAPGGIVLPGQE